MFRFLIATSALALTAASAEAATMKAVYTGTVYSSYDQTGVFGEADTSLDGLSYLLTFIYDTALGNRNTLPGYYDEVSGGEVYSASTDPILSAKLTINGKSFSVDGSYQGFAGVQSDNSSYSNYYHYAHEYDPGDEDGKYKYSYINQNSNFTEGTVPELDVATTLTGSYYSYWGYFQKYEYDYTTGAYLSYAHGYLDPDKLVITRYTPDDGGPAPVPLPAAAGLMAAALGALGTLARRRRSA